MTLARAALLLLCTVCATARPSAWELVDRPPSTSGVDYKIALRQSNLGRLEALALEVSDPNSARYGQHLSNTEIASIIAPPAHKVVKLIRELQDLLPSASIELAPHGDYLLVKSSVLATEAAFGLELYRYQRSISAKRSLTATRAQITPTLAQWIANHDIVEDFYGLIDLPPDGRFGHDGNRPQLYKGIHVNPPIISAMYNVTAQGGKQTKNSQALAEFEEEWFYPADIPRFTTKYHLPNVNISTLIGIDNPNKGYLGEATLDVEYILGVAPLVDTWVWYQDIFDIVSWAINVTSTPNAPKVHSISYGSGESTYDNKTMTRWNTEFMVPKKMAAAGYSVLAASGDSGTGNTGMFWCGTFDPTFPATSPWVTAVGGTYLTAYPGGQEITWPDSGGGFSTIFPRPQWQEAVVSKYLQQSNLPATTFFNSKGRAIPDVGAFASNLEVVMNGAWGVESGTSAATPIFAAIVSLLNDVRLSSGKSQLGFLNPWLYSVNTIGYDITQGNNKDYYCTQGFPASPGWDATTGLGTPNYELLLAKL